MTRHDRAALILALVGGVFLLAALVVWLATR